MRSKEDLIQEARRYGSKAKTWRGIIRFITPLLTERREWLPGRRWVLGPEEAKRWRRERAWTKLNKLAQALELDLRDLVFPTMIQVVGKWKPGRGEYGEIRPPSTSLAFSEAKKAFLGEIKDILNSLGGLPQIQELPPFLQREFLKWVEEAGWEIAHRLLDHFYEAWASDWLWAEGVVRRWASGQGIVFEYDEDEKEAWNWSLYGFDRGQGLVLVQVRRARIGKKWTNVNKAYFLLHGSGWFLPVSPRPIYKALEEGSPPESPVEAVVSHLWRGRTLPWVGDIGLKRTTAPRTFTVVPEKTVKGATVVLEAAEILQVGSTKIVYKDPAIYLREDGKATELLLSEEGYFTVVFPRKVENFLIREGFLKAYSGEEEDRAAA